MHRSVFLVLLIPSLATATETILPGLYETTINTQMKMGDMQMPARADKQTNCITAEDVANGPPLPEPDEADCDIVKYEFGDGKLDMELVCQMQGGSGRMVGTGTYTSDTYEMKNQFKMEAQGLQFEMNSTATGRRVKDC